MMASPDEQHGDSEAKASTTQQPVVKSIIQLGKRHAFYNTSRGQRFNMVALHRMNLHFLRKRILDEAGTIFKQGDMTDSNSDVLTSLMEKYCAYNQFMLPS
jgi:hypothetical protein